MKALSTYNASVFRWHWSGIYDQNSAHDVTTLGDCGGLCVMAFGSHTTRASQSAFAIPFDKTSPKASRKAFSGQPISSARPASPMRINPGNEVVHGPVSRYIQRLCAFGCGLLREMNLSSAHMLTSTFR